MEITASLSHHTLLPTSTHAADASLPRGACVTCTWPRTPACRTIQARAGAGAGPVPVESTAPSPPLQVTKGVDTSTMNMMMMRLVEGGLVYRETLVVRSYEIGVDKTASLETFLNHFQESALNHVRMSGLLGDGFGATHGMIRNHLIWVVTRMQVEIKKYPLWGDVIELDTWVGASGKNGMRRDWLVRDFRSGEVLARATSTWVMMNRRTRRLSKIPDEVRAEISPWFIDRCAIKEASSSERINKVNDDAVYIKSDLKPQRKDLDMNQHVNNVKYVGWMLETIPTSIQECYELESITLEYRKECGQSDLVQALTTFDAKSASGDKSISNLMNRICTPQEELNTQNLSYPTTLLPLSTSGFLNITNLNLDYVNTVSKDLGNLHHPLQYTHLLRLQQDGTEIVRGETKWRNKGSKAG